MAVCPQCGDYYADQDDAEIVSGNEVFDLIAEAAKVSPHAARAYEKLREVNPAIPNLETRQRLIAARMMETVA